ncbi:MAG: glycosyl transferase family 51 [Daejeonella sp.]|nr:glycosyl transferase family 51 [Daejeonella sp.]
MQIPRKYIQITLITFFSLTIVLLIAGIIGYSKREALLKHTVEKAITKARNDYNLIVKIKGYRFSGLRSVDFEDISIVPVDRDSLATIQSLRVGVKLWPLIFGNVKLGELKLNKGKINLIHRDSISNYDFLFRKKGDDSLKKSHKSNLADLANNLLNQLLYKIPDDMDIKDFNIHYSHNATAFDFNTTSATIVDGHVKSTIKVNGSESTWHLNGEVNPDDKQLDIKLFADGKKVELPYIEKRFGLKLNFDTIRTQLIRAKTSGDEFKISGSWAINNLLISHPKIASNDVIVPNASIDADITVGENYFAVDSTSTIHLKTLKAHPFIKYTLSPSKIYELKLHTEEMDAQELFNSFPLGLFESLDGIQVAGKLQYDMNFYLNKAKPNSVLFDSQLNKKNFKIVKWGKMNLEKINSPFIYTPYEYGKPMRDIMIGQSNPNFTPLTQISPYLRNALLTAEDPSFYTHKGFVLESFRKSIITNLQEKAFKRGGSTISMQLVKNVYLSRQKTVARKIEEILIVWIIENTRLASKERMFEVYLNLIEWGRNVYGIGEASRFYFNKQPADLDLGESIFLASIVPRPKSGLYFFEGDGSLRTGLRGYFKLIGNLMAKRGYTVRDTNAYGFYSVRLKESLRRGTVVDTLLPLDTLSTDEEFIAPDEPNFFERLFGKKKPDSLKNKNEQLSSDTTKSLSRKEKRELRRREKELKKIQEQTN